MTHVLAGVIAGGVIPAVLLAGTWASRLSNSILTDDDGSASWFALAYGIVSAAVGATLAVAISSRPRNGSPLVARWGPVVGLVLLSTSMLALTALTAWSWGHSPDATVRQNVAQDTRHGLPIVTMATFIGAMSYGLWSRTRRDGAGRRRAVAGLLFALPPIVATVIPLILTR